MLKINEKLLKEIVSYCELNQISDVDHFVNNLLQTAFTAHKYGSVPTIVAVKPQIINTPEPLEIEEPKIQITKIKNENDDYQIYDNFD